MRCAGLDRYNEPKECDAGAGEDCDEKTSSWGRFQNRSRESRGFDIDAKVQVFITTPLPVAVYIGGL